MVNNQFSFPPPSRAPSTFCQKTMGPAPRLVVVADDFGVNSFRCDGISEAFRKGSVHALSVLANGECTEQKLRELKAAVPAFCSANIGLHANLTEGPALSGVSTLTDENAMFLGKVRLRHLLSSGAVHHDDIVKELTAQVDHLHGIARRVFLDESDVKLRHFDGHNHFHTQGEVLKPVASCMSHLGFHTTRIPYDVEYADEVTPSVAKEEFSVFDTQAKFHLRVAAEAVQAKEAYSAHGIKATEVFAGLKELEECSEERVCAMLERVLQKAEGSVEVMTHVGFAVPEDRAGWGIPFYDDFFSRSPNRDLELQVWTSKRVCEVAAKFAPSNFLEVHG